MHPDTDGGRAAALAPIDTREAQALRAADHMERHPEGATLVELNAAGDLGSPTKVLSAMRRDLGYGIRRGWRRVPCVAGTKARRVRVYFLVHRPAPAAQLPLDLR